MAVVASVQVFPEEAEEGEEEQRPDARHQRGIGPFSSYVLP